MNQETFIELGSGETFIRNDDLNMSKTPSTFILKRGAGGATLNFKLFDERRQPVRLDGCAVTVTARKNGASPVLENLPCAVGTNQRFDGAGFASFKFDENSARIPAGKYDLEFTVTDADGGRRKFPNTQKQPFAKLIVQESL